MPEFVWKAARSSAEIVEGHLQAPSAGQALQQLRAQGLTPLHISEAAPSPTASIGAAAASASTPARRLFQSQAITSVDILAMSSELSIMLKAGLALDTALRVLIGMSSKPTMSTLTQTILDDVKGGAALSKALARHPQHFSDFYINMVRSGEASGQLSAVLERLVEHLERLRSLRESVISAIIYPSILLGVAILSLVGMLGFVVPQFETLFKGMGDALPTPTRLVMALGDAFTHHAPYIAVAAILLGWGLRRWWRSPTGQSWWQTQTLRLPVLGTLLRKYDLTLFARSLGTLLGNGVPLLSALSIATQTVGNIHLRQALEKVVPQVKDGGKIVDALKATGIFEPLAISLVKVGEETGRMGPMLLELARIFNRDVENGIKRALTLLEPILILVLGVLISSIIVSIMMGILAVNDLAV